MGKNQINKVALVAEAIWIAAIAAFYWWGYHSARGAQLLNAFLLLVLIWSFLSPLYLLIQIGFAFYQRKKAARLGLTPAEFHAQWLLKHPPRPAMKPRLEAAARRSRDRWHHRLVRIKPWELGVCTALLVLLSALAEHWRGRPDAEGYVGALALLYIAAVYSLLGLQILHRAWARWHHRLAPGSPTPENPLSQETLSTPQKLWNGAFLLALLVTLVEFGRDGQGEFGFLVLAALMPVLTLLLVRSTWRLLHHLFRGHLPDPA